MRTNVRSLFANDWLPIEAAAHQKKTDKLTKLERQRKKEKKYMVTDKIAKEKYKKTIDTRIISGMVHSVSG